MGKSTDETLVLISTVAGCIQTLIDTHAFARVDIQRKMQTGFDAARRAIGLWPGFYNREWVKDKREEFRLYVMAMPDVGYSAAAVVKMCDRVLCDLLERDSGLANKIALLAPIHDAVRVVDNFIDMDGRNFQAYKKSDELIDKLYEIIGYKIKA